MGVTARAPQEPRPVPQGCGLCPHLKPVTLESHLGDKNKKGIASWLWLSVCVPLAFPALPGSLGGAVLSVSLGRGQGGPCLVVWPG